MTRSQVVARARSALGHQVIYSMDQTGKARPGDDVPWLVDTEGRRYCDCSRFAFWALGFHGRLVGGVYYDTSAIAADARSQGPLFRSVGMLESEPGDLLVYGDATGHQGHVGVISGVTPKPESWPLEVIHCSGGNYRRTKDAIRETGPDIWLHRSDSLVARCLGLTEDPPA